MKWAMDVDGIGMDEQILEIYSNHLREPYVDHGMILDSPNQVYDLGYIYNGSGTWEIRTASVPDASMCLLLCPVLAGLVAIGRKKFKK